MGAATKQTASMSGSKAPDDADDDLVSLLQALDATLDEASETAQEIDVANSPEPVGQLVALVTAAEALADQIMEQQGIFDADDDEPKSRKRRTKSGPRVRPCPQFGAKTVAIKFKSDGLADGEFIGYASVFGNKDSYGDIVNKGAFTNTLAEWDRSGLKIPVLWGHNTSDPDFNLGECITAVEDDHGLKVHVKLDLECPKAASTYRLLKGGRVNQMSFSYWVVDGAYVQPEGDGMTYRDAYYELRELDLFEVSVVPIGANQETEILAVKSVVAALASKAGRVLSSANVEIIKNAIAQLETALEALEGVLPDEDDDPADEQEKDQGQTSGKEPPPGTSRKKSPEPATLSPSVSLAQIEMQLLEMELI